LSQHPSSPRRVSPAVKGVLTALCLIVGTCAAVVIAVPNPSIGPVHVHAAPKVSSPGLKLAEPVPAIAPTTTTTTALPAPPVTTVSAAPRPVTAAAPPTTAPAAPAAVVSAPSSPSASIPPSPNFYSVCASGGFDQSAACVDTSVAAINHARVLSGLPDMALPSNWSSLDAAQQVFVATNLERTVRGLFPLSAMASALDAAAAVGVQTNSDPAPPTGFPWTMWGANWAGGNLSNPLEAMYLWMYDDGPGGENLNCTAANPSGCWIHRRNVLLGLACTPCVMGAAWGAGAGGITSGTEILADTSSSPALDFTWADEQSYLG